MIIVNRLKMKNIKVVIWDCDNTIWIHRKDEENIVAQELGIPVTQEFNDQYFNMFEKFEEFFEHKRITDERIVKFISKSMPILSSYNITAEEFLKKWLPLNTSFLNEDALETIKYLKEKGYENIVLTDWIWSSQVKLLKHYGIYDYMDRVYTCDGQYLKKNPKSVSRIVKKGHEKDYVIVGDSLKSDIAFANNAGIRSIWYNPYHKENKTKYYPTTEVTSLLEVIEIVD